VSQNYDRGGAKRREVREVNVIKRKKKFKRSRGGRIYSENNVTIGSQIWPEAA